MKLFALSPALWRALFVVFFLLMWSVELCEAIPSAAAQTTKKSTTTKTTKATTTKTTKTTTSKTTKSTTSKTTKTTKTTSSKALYSWKTVPARSNCPTYTTTLSSAFQTFSASGSVATAYVDPNTGIVPLQIATTDANGNPLIFRTYNSSQIQIFKPGSFVMIVDNSGPYVFDESCQSGVRLSVNNFFNVTNTTSSSKRSLIDTDTEVDTDTDVTPTMDLARRTTQEVYLGFTFVDQCGYRLAENITHVQSTLSCDCLNYTILNNPNAYGGLYDPGQYTIGYPIPSINTTSCISKASNISSYFTSGAVSDALSTSAFSNSVPQIGAQAAASPEAAAIIQKLGSGLNLSALSQALVPLSAIYSFISGGPESQFPDLLCFLDYNLQVVVDTLHFNNIQVLSEVAPIKHIVTHYAITLPTKIHDPCTTTYPVSHAFTNVDCQVPAPTHAVIAQGCPAFKPSPTDACNFDGTTTCGLANPPGGACECYSDYAGNAMCFQPHLIGDCVHACTSDADCGCGSKCSWNVNCCGGSRCVDVASCYRTDYTDYYDIYYENQLMKRTLPQNLSESELELWTRQILGPA